MKVTFDYRIFTMQKYGGISRYFSNLAACLVELNVNLKVFAGIHKNDYLQEMPREVITGLHLKRFPPKSTKAFLKLNQILYNAWSLKVKPDIVHETFYSNGCSIYKDQALRVITVFDMIHELFPENFPSDKKTIETKRLAIKNADHIICISENTKSDLLAIYGLDPSKISVIYLGCRVPSGGYIESINLPENYLLYVGHRNGYKNFYGFINEFSRSKTLKRDFSIICFGGGSFSERERDYFKTLDLDIKRIRQVTGSDELLNSYFKSAAAFVYPSLYEGFGLPILEAMANRCPVICSNTSSMPEVGRNAAVYFDPNLSGSLQQTLEETLYHTNLMDDLKIRGAQNVLNFSWGKCARKTFEVYKRLGKI